MKKIVYILILLLFPFTVYGKSGIEGYRIDITILENGDIDIIESFQMNGVYNGFEKVLNYKNNFENYYGTKISSTGDPTILEGNGVKVNEVRGINFNFVTPMESFFEYGDLFNLEKKAVKGDYGVYVINETTDGLKCIIYNHSKMNKDFYISYTLKKMAIMHKDIGELVYNLFPIFNENILDLEVYIHIPKNENLLKIWTHNGNNTSEIIDFETIKIKANNLETGLDFRIVFDKEVINKSTKITEIEALDNIYEIETRLYLEANEQTSKLYEQLKSDAYNMVEKAIATKSYADYKKALELTNSLNNEDLKYDLQNKLEGLLIKINNIALVKKSLFTLVSLIMIIGTLTVYIIFSIKYRYKKGTSQNTKSYGPATLGYLLRKKITINDLSASILNLINLKVIKCVVLDDDNLKLIRLNTKKELKESDIKLLNFLFNDKKEVLLNDLKSKVKKNHEIFIMKYSNWINQAIKDAEQENFYEDILILKLFGVIFSFCGLIYGLITIANDSFINPYFLIIFSSISLIYYLLLKKRTSYGNEQLDRWLDFKKDFMSNIKTHESLKNNLTYMITLGNFNKITKKLKRNNHMLNFEVDEIIKLNKTIIKSIKNIVKSAYIARNYKTDV